MIDALSNGSFTSRIGGGALFIGIVLMAIGFAGNAYLFTAGIFFGTIGAIMAGISIISNIVSWVKSLF